MDHESLPGLWGGGVGGGRESEKRVAVYSHVHHNLFNAIARSYAYSKLIITYPK